MVGLIDWAFRFKSGKLFWLVFKLKLLMLAEDVMTLLVVLFQNRKKEIFYPLETNVQKIDQMSKDGS